MFTLCGITEHQLTQKVADPAVQVAVATDP